MSNAKENRFHIVVPNLNYGDYLAECLASLEEQVKVALSVVVVDGGSIDTSREVAEEFCKRNDWKLLIRPGLGQAASIALGFSEAPKDNDVYFGWLNSDDVYLRSDALWLVAQYFQTMRSVFVLSLGGVFIDKHGGFLRPVVYDYHPLLRGDVTRRGGGLLQPSTFWRGCVSERVEVNVRFKYVFDVVLFTEMRGLGYNVYRKPTEHIAGYRLHGSNLSAEVSARRVRELSVLYGQYLKRPYSAFYLRIIAWSIALIDRLPFASRWLKRLLYGVLNAVSYFSVYRIPSI